MNTTTMTKMHHEMVALRERAEKAEAELAMLRVQAAVVITDDMITAADLAMFSKPIHGVGRLQTLRCGLEAALAVAAPAVQDASLIPQGFQVWHNTDNPDLTDDANNEHRWIVERLYKPWSGTSGARRWFGKTLESAMRNAISDLGMVMPAMPASAELVEPGGCAPAVIAAPAVALEVWFGSMPESNGKTNWTAILHRGDITQGITIGRSEYKDRVRYEADKMRWMIGELEEKPRFLDYDADLHSGYKTSAVPAPSVPDGDDFNGTTQHLILCMETLVRLDTKGVLVPHGIGRRASRLLTVAANRLRKQVAPSVPEEWRKALQEAHDTFQRYADLHRAKDTPDGHEKAKANQKLANKLYALLQSAPAVPAPEFRTSAKDSGV